MNFDQQGARFRYVLLNFSRSTRPRCVHIFSSLYVATGTGRVSMLSAATSPGGAVCRHWYWKSFNVVCSDISRRCRMSPPVWEEFQCCRQRHLPEVPYVATGMGRVSMLSAATSPGGAVCRSFLPLRRSICPLYVL